MTKADFIELVQKNGEYESRKEAEKAVKVFIEFLKINIWKIK